MIVDETKTIVTQSIAQALERMAFLDVLPCLETPPAPNRILRAEIDFTGSMDGSIHVVAGLDFARELAGNMGLLDQPTEEQCTDALRELVNVTCGLVLPLLTTPEADVFNVSIPRVHPADGSMDWDQWIQRDDVAVLDVVEHPVAVCLNLISETKGNYAGPDSNHKSSHRG